MILPLRLLLGTLHVAVKDSYVRRTSKKARHWPHKKKDTPPGLPRIQMPSQEQLESPPIQVARVKPPMQ
jgi:hypothetical protein